MKEVEYDLGQGIHMSAEPNRKLFNVHEYHRMVEVGILRERERVELIEGEIVQMTAIGHRHWVRVARLTSLFIETFGKKVVTSIQGPARLSEWSEPEPDVTVFKPRADFYAGKQPGPEDILFVVEVADSSLSYDNRVKATLYAKAGIQEYWIEDLISDTMLVYRHPVDGQYTTVLALNRQDSISPLAFPDISFQVDNLLGAVVTE